MLAVVVKRKLVLYIWDGDYWKDYKVGFGLFYFIVLFRHSSLNGF
jgi:hypothetical protein